MKKLNISWPALVGVVVAFTLISCNNQKAQEKYEKEQAIANINIPAFEEVFEKANREMDELPIDEIIIPEGLEVEEEDTSFTR